MKRLKSLALLAFLWAGPVLAAGTTPLALVPQFDLQGNVAAGCLVYFYQAGTVSTKQNVYSDFGLTQALPNPLSCDQSGRVPMHWLADGLIHVQLVTSSGTPIVDTTLQTLGPSSGGGGGGGTVDPTSVLSTGDEKVRYGTGPLSGFVRENGLTIGNATSGATERANADTQNLFVYLYQTDANLVVSGGRTGNALNDYNAGKTISLPDMRGRINGFLADMGNSATTVLTSTYAGCNSTVTTLGAACGSQNHTQTLAELVTHFHGATINDPGHQHTLGGNGTAFITSGSGSGIGGGGSFGITTPGRNILSDSNTTGVRLKDSVNGFDNTASVGGGNPFTIVPPIMLKTAYIKL